jgi:hypothetical protein
LTIEYNTSEVSPGVAVVPAAAHDDADTQEIEEMEASGLP